MKIEEIIEKFRKSYAGHSRNIEKESVDTFGNVPGLIKQSQKGVKFIFAMQPNESSTPQHQSYHIIKYELSK
jgi:hypothetical protein